MTDLIDAGRVASLLASGEKPWEQRAAAIASRLVPDLQLRLSRQPAARSAETLRLKYELARDRGIQVEGLEDFVAALVAMGDGWIRACVVEGVEEFAVVVLSDTAGEVAAVLYVPTPGSLPEPSRSGPEEAV